MLATAMWFGRFAVIMPVLAIAGSLGLPALALGPLPNGCARSTALSQCLTSISQKPLDARMPLFMAQRGCHEGGVDRTSFAACKCHWGNLLPARISELLNERPLGHTSSGTTTPDSAIFRIYTFFISHRLVFSMHVTSGKVCRLLALTR
jgi:hypothetical protein